MVRFALKPAKRQFGAFVLALVVLSYYLPVNQFQNPPFFDSVGKLLRGC